MWDLVQYLGFRWSERFNIKDRLNLISCSSASFNEREENESIYTAVNGLTKAIIMSDILIKPIGFVKNSRMESIDDNWSSVESTIELIQDFPDECLNGIEQFSHLEIIYHFNKSTKTFIGSEHPRENKNYPNVGIFAQRKKDRPNHIGATIVNLISRTERSLIVKNLDAINGTPIIDIKPVFDEYLPKGDIKQPEWTKDLMKNYW
jgi:tRNA-Thr(GGU) m(6)t(6)A37 methyltransferase TsaA